MSMEKIKELRERTHLGMSECKKALDEANGEVESAIEILQKKNFKLKIDPTASVAEGMVFATVKGNIGNIVEVNCQTDFAARSTDFLDFVKKVSDTCSDELLDTVTISKNLEDKLKLTSKVLGEQLIIRKVQRLSNNLVAAYNHPGGKISVLVGIQCPDEYEDHIKLQEFADNVAMHIAAVNPMALDRNSLDKKEIVKQQEIFELQMKEDTKPKPQNILDKIIEGKFNKWYAENVLLEQESVVEPKNTIQDLLNRLNKDLGTSSITISQFIRLERGTN